jgi:hypothetical protein
LAGDDDTGPAEISDWDLEYLVRLMIKTSSQLCARAKPAPAKPSEVVEQDDGEGEIAFVLLGE